MSNKKTLITQLGYEVVGEMDGVYHLKAADSPEQFVSLLKSDAAQPQDATKVTMLLFALTPGLPVERVLEHWRNLDARRLSGPDVTEIDVPLPAGVAPSGIEHLSFLRPTGSGLRYATRLVTGDIVCFN